MKTKILLTSTSFHDTTGDHQKLLYNQDFSVSVMRGPLEEKDILAVIDEFDGIICGDDEITRDVIKKGADAKLKVISKYGSGLDKIDLPSANEFKIPVESCPAINQTTVAEHVFALLLSYCKNIIQENNLIQNQKWERLTGIDLYGKTLGVFGTGNVGKEVIKRALAFGMKVVALDKYPDYDFATEFKIVYANTPESFFELSDIISLNANLDSNSKNMINEKSIELMKNGVIIVNTARAGLVDQDQILKSINRGKIKAYLTDVLEKEPMEKSHPFLNNKNILITPHIASRTYENVERQGLMAVKNLIKNLI
ncbi:hypothetical protein N9D85_06495 [Flavobacteriaceae bacterium]|nr:hypothetical protein [Flavobacteriaceae bacterium]